MKRYNIHEAKTQLSRLIDAAAAGEEIVIAKAGKPMVRLIPWSATAGPRTLGAIAGQVRESDDCWAPDPELEAMFYGPSEEVRKPMRVAERPRRK